MFSQKNTIFSTFKRKQEIFREKKFIDSEFVKRKHEQVRYSKERIRISDFTPCTLGCDHGRVIYWCHSYNNVKFVTARVASQWGQKNCEVAFLNFYKVTFSCYILSGLLFLRYNKDV